MSQKQIVFNGPDNMQNIRKAQLANIENLYGGVALAGLTQKQKKYINMAPGSQMQADTLKISKKVLLDQQSNSKSPSVDRSRIQRSIANSDSNPLLANDTGTSIA